MYTDPFFMLYVELHVGHMKTIFYRSFLDHTKGSAGLL
jgi:hypothetical protein